VLTRLKSQKQHVVHMILPMQHLLLMAIHKGALFMPRLRGAKEPAWYIPLVSWRSTDMSAFDTASRSSPSSVTNAHWIIHLTNMTRLPSIPCKTDIAEENSCIPARSNWPKTSPIFGTCSGVSLHNSGNPRIACTRIYNPSHTLPYCTISTDLSWH
jgi:hypothetical protein